MRAAPTLAPQVPPNVSSRATHIMSVLCAGDHAQHDRSAHSPPLLGPNALRKRAHRSVCTKSQSIPRLRFPNAVHAFMRCAAQRSAANERSKQNDWQNDRGHNIDPPTTISSNRSVPGQRDDPLCTFLRAPAATCAMYIDARSCANTCRSAHKHIHELHRRISARSKKRHAEYGPRLGDKALARPG